MPIMKPEVQRVLRAAGLEKSDDRGTVEQNLDSAGLSNDVLAEQLTSIALRSNNDALRMRALETALKVKGAMQNLPTTIPSFTIVIQNSGLTETPRGAINPIIFPRQSLKNGPPLEVPVEDYEIVNEVDEVEPEEDSCEEED